MMTCRVTMGSLMFVEKKHELLQGNLAGWNHYLRETTHDWSHFRSLLPKPIGKLDWEGTRFPSPTSGRWINVIHGKGEYQNVFIWKDCLLSCSFTFPLFSSFKAVFSWLCFLCSWYFHICSPPESCGNVASPSTKTVGKKTWGPRPKSLSSSSWPSGVGGVEPRLAHRTSRDMLI